MAIVEVEHVTKEFRLGELGGLKAAAFNQLRRLAGRAPIERPLFRALDDVCFSVEAGEVLGIIGHNGAGKSTLLKLLAGISKPSRGRVSLHGRIAPLIEVGAGFVPDMTGRENVYLNGAILGLTRRQIDAKLDEIVAFAEMEQFIDTPVKRYSSGMKVKLAFAVATSVEAEVLIVDEVLAVGDLAFQRKCFDRMEYLIRKQGRTVLLVSHNIRQVERMCSRVLLMEHGRVAADGKPTAVCNLFYEKSDQQIVRRAMAKPVAQLGRAMSSGEVELVSLAMFDRDGNPLEDVEYRSDITLAMVFRVHRPVRRPVFGIGVHTTDFLYLATNHSSSAEAPAILAEGEHEVRCRIREFPFLPNVYSWRVGMAVGDKGETAFYVENAFPFKVVDSQMSRASPDVAEGFVSMQCNWSVPVAVATGMEDRSTAAL